MAYSKFISVHPRRHVLFSSLMSLRITGCSTCPHFSLPLHHPLSFGDHIRAARSNIAKVIDSATGPGDDEAINAIIEGRSEGDGEVRLGELAGAALHPARSLASGVVDSRPGANGATVGFSAHQPQTQCVKTVQQ